MTAKKKGTHLFIDTNVLLNFYAYSKDDLEQLEKLVKIVKIKTVKLYVTQQVVDEFYRNRDSKLSESFDNFRPFGSESCPSFMTSLPEYKTYRKSLQTYKAARNALTQAARIQAESRELFADQLFARIIEQTSVIDVDDTAYAAANKRARLGNPPGKSSSTIGDEVNWELLLKHIPEGTDLHVITKDSDYASKLDPNKAKVFLADEWTRIKKSTLYLYEQISLFFKTNYPDEDFSLETEKRALIDALVGSYSFASTHAAVASLEPYVPFLTDEEAQELVQGSFSNSQVAWIVSDSDVQALLKKILEVHGTSLSSTILRRLQEALGIEPEEQAHTLSSHARVVGL